MGLQALLGEPALAVANTSRILPNNLPLIVRPLVHIPSTLTDDSLTS